VSLLEVSGLVVEYAGQQGRVRAVDGVDLAVEERTTVGLVGESGSGKTSFARALVGLIPAREGRIAVEGVDVTGSSARKHLRRSVQLIFQDPYGSLNPRMTIDEILGEAITTHHRVSGQQRRARITELLDQVGLPAAARLSYPFQFSGGQRQRIAIARALAVRPRLLVADEVTSSLDVSVQAAILNLLVELQRELGIAYLVISHDLSVIRYLCDAVNVMHLARIVESAPTDALFERPQHPYTSALLASVPQVGGEHGRFEPLEGEVPDPLHPPSGCRFRTRCPVGPIYRPERAVCIERDPHEDAAGHAHAAACHFAGAVTTNHVEQEVAL
jgi:peptide/nickel transport system ATP-binding protein